MADFQVYTWYGVVENLAVDVILETKFIHLGFWGISRQKENCAIALKASWNFIVKKPSIRNREYTIRIISRWKRIQNGCHSSGKSDKDSSQDGIIHHGGIDRSSMMRMERCSNQKKRSLLIAARGIEHVQDHSEFLIRCINISNRPVLLCKHTKVALGTDLPIVVVLPHENEASQACKDGQAYVAEKQ